MWQDSNPQPLCYEVCPLPLCYNRCAEHCLLDTLSRNELDNLASQQVFGELKCGLWELRPVSFECSYQVGLLCRGCGSAVGKVTWVKEPQKRFYWADVSSTPGCDIGIREKMLATPSLGVWGKSHIRRNKCARFGLVAKKRGTVQLEALPEHPDEVDQPRWRPASDFIGPGNFLRGRNETRRIFFRRIKKCRGQSFFFDKKV